MKKIVIISDLHAGSAFGLSSPEYWQREYPKRYAMQKESWNAYASMTRKWAKPDLLVVNGDCIDGTQSKSCGAELVTNDRLEQCKMAKICIEAWKAKKILMTFGTAYHVSETGEDFERQIADDLGATIEGRLFFKIEDLIFDCRHKIGSSGIPHGRATAILRDVSWGILKSALDEEPRADVLVRSHVHYHIWVEQPGRVAFTTPALQLSRGRYGSRECTGETHWGAIRLTVHKGQIIGKDVICHKLVGNKHKILKVA